MVAPTPSTLHSTPQTSATSISTQRRERTRIRSSSTTSSTSTPTGSPASSPSTTRQARSARDRSHRPRLALLRRFAFLGILGGVHQLLQPGEALLPYALAGIVFLLPATWIADRWRNVIATVLGVALLIAGVATGGGMALIPGLFLLGFAIGGSDFLRSVLNRPGRVAIAGGIALIVEIDGFSVTDYTTRQIDQWINAGLGLCMALTCIVAILLLLRTPTEAVLKSVLAPLGRMALSNYVGATVIFVAVRLAVPDLARFDDHGGYVAGLVICAAIIIARSSSQLCGCAVSDRARWRSCGASSPGVGRHSKASV